MTGSAGRAALSEEPAQAGAPPRLPLIDAARGVAIVAMAVYHFSWDLRYFGFITADVTGDLGWRLFARAIAGSFLFIVGVSLVLATRNGFRRGPTMRRLAMIVAAAAAVSLVTYFTSPNSFIFFGILHHIAVASVLGLAFVNAPVLLVGAASVASFLLPTLLTGGVFDAPAFIWLGLASYLPRTDDFVPVFPWFGVVLAGIFAARVSPRIWPEGLPDGGLARRTPRALLWAGRHSLLIYLVHQPVLFGLVALAAQVAPQDLRTVQPTFIESCTRACVESEVEPGVCRSTCACVAQRSQAAGLWDDLMRQSLTEAQEILYFDLTAQCRAEAEP